MTRQPKCLECRESCTGTCARHRAPELEDRITWEGAAVFITHDPNMAPTLGPYAVCVRGATHAVIIGRTDNRERAIRVAERLDRYPERARTFAGLLA